MIKCQTCQSILTFQNQWTTTSSGIDSSEDDVKGLENDGFYMETIFFIVNYGNKLGLQETVVLIEWSSN